MGKNKNKNKVNNGNTRTSTPHAPAVSMVCMRPFGIVRSFYRLPFVLVVLVYFAHVAGFATVKNYLTKSVSPLLDTFCPN